MTTTDDPKPPTDANEPVTTAVIAELRAHVDLIAERRRMLPAGGFDPDLSAAASQIGKALVSLLAEVRAREKMAARDREALQPHAVMEWFRQLPVEVRLHVVREMTSELDDAGSVLA